MVGGVGRRSAGAAGCRRLSSAKVEWSGTASLSSEHSSRTALEDGLADPDRCRVHTDVFASQLTTSNYATCRHALASRGTTWRTRAASTSWLKTMDATGRR